MMRNCEMWLVPHANMVLSCEMRSVPHANEGQETSNALGNRFRQWTSTGLADVKVVMFDNQFCTLMSERQRLSERDCSKPLTKMHSVIQIWIFLHIVSAWGLSSCMRGVYFALKMLGFFLYICNQYNRWSFWEVWGWVPKSLPMLLSLNGISRTLSKIMAITCLVECLSSAGSA